MKKSLIIILSICLIFCLTSCGTKLPYDLTGTVSVELHAYDSISEEPFAKIVVNDPEHVSRLVDTFASLKLKELEYTEPSILGYEFWFKDAAGNELAYISLPYGPWPWVVVRGTAYADVNGGIDLDYLAELLNITVTTEIVEPNTSNDRNGRPYAPYIGDYVTSVDVTHILSGQLQKCTIMGEQLVTLRTWANGLNYEHRTYEDGQSPGDTDGGEIYEFVLTEGDYPGFTYVINGPNDCYLLIEGEWFVVTNPTNPPIE